MYIYIYILYPSPHCPSRDRNDVDIYIELFINKVYQNNDNNNKNNNDNNKIIIDFPKMHNSTNVYVQSQSSLR